MLKSFSICGALILAAAAFSTSAEAQHRGFGGGARMGGAHFSGARVGPLAVPAWGTWPALAEWVPMAVAPFIVVADMLAAMPFMAVADMRMVMDAAMAIVAMAAIGLGRA